MRVISATAPPEDCTPILGSGLTECYSSSVSQFVVETVAYALRKGALYLCLYRVWYADSELAEFSVV